MLSNSNTMTLVSVQPRKWTRDEYYRLGTAAVFPADERVELIHGEIVPMSPHDPLHSGAVENLSTVIHRVFGHSHCVRVQLPLSISKDSDPEPDVFVLRHELARQFRQVHTHPNQGNLVIEVARTSLAYDRLEKHSLYAEAGIPEYWIINLVDRVVEVYREPMEDPSAPFGWSYRKVIRYVAGELLCPLFDDNQLRVDDIFADL
ncbi:MAG: Uma2 family endonuclease [Armatimonadetes bacterium]|nr:Uma2 family endonuclease [Armatimonadota bacterium]